VGCAHPERLLAVADAIEKAPDRQFDMASWMMTWAGGPIERVNGPEDIPDPSCGTAACMAGWTLWVFPEETKAILDDPDRSGYIDRVAQEILGLSSNDAYRLFRGLWHPDVRCGYGLRNITKDEAVAELRRLAAEDAR
jgi:hypothetical protein